MKIPISITKILEEKYRTRGDNSKFLSESFLIETEERGSKWNLSHKTYRSDVIKFRNQLNEVLGFKNISKNFNCTIEEAEKISNYQEGEDICTDCLQKDLICFNCIFTCQSPLEQKLFVALKNEGIDCELQRRIRKDGSGYPKNYPVNKKTILTLPDFYIENSSKKICIYADGHTYHERTENQALRDRNIDRELQSLGYVCLRFTGKEIRENISDVVNHIKKVMNSNLSSVQLSN